MALYGLVRDSVAIGIAKRIARRPKAPVKGGKGGTAPAYYAEQSVGKWFLQGVREGLEGG